LRVTSAIWVAAMVRQYYGVGAIATVARRGAEEAGAIFVIMDNLSGQADLYGPAPQAAFDEDRPDDRKFQKIVDDASLAAISERLDREFRFDPDIWVVAVEDRQGRILFDAI
jgi:hypothetical protein